MANRAVAARRCPGDRAGPRRVSLARHAGWPRALRRLAVRAVDAAERRQYAACQPGRCPDRILDGRLVDRLLRRRGVAHLHQGRATRYLAADGAPPGVNALIEDRRGTIWATSADGLFRFDGRRWSRLTSEDGYDGEQSVSVYEDHLGRIWVGSARGLYRSDQGSFHLVDRAATRVESLAEDEAGNLWITDRTAGVRKLGAPRATAPPGHTTAAARLAHGA